MYFFQLKVINYRYIGSLLNRAFDSLDKTCFVSTRKDKDKK